MLPAHLGQAIDTFAEVDRLSRHPGDFSGGRKALSYTPIDVLAGTALGCIVAMLLV